MAESVRETLRKAAIPFAIILCTFYSGKIFLNYLEFGKFSNDFGVYWRTANQSVELAYLWRGRFPFPYAPTMLLWISPLAWIPKWPAYLLFVAISTAAFALACRPYLPKAAIALAVISPPFARGMFTGQVSVALAALMIWACGTTNRVGAGIAFGLAASVKPQLVIMAPLMLALNRDWRAFGAAAATFIVTIIMSLSIFGVARWPEWIASMDHFHHAVADTNVINIGVSPATFAERLGYPPLPFMIFGCLGGAAIVYLCRNRSPLEQASAITLSSLLAAPYSLAYDLVGVMPLLALAVFQGRILAAVGMASSLHPLPLAISTFELLTRKARDSDDEEDSCTTGSEPAPSAPPLPIQSRSY